MDWHAPPCCPAHVVPPPTLPLRARHNPVPHIPPVPAPPVPQDHVLTTDKALELGRCLLAARQASDADALATLTAATRALISSTAGCVRPRSPLRKPHAHDVTANPFAAPPTAAVAAPELALEHLDDWQRRAVMRWVRPPHGTTRTDASGCGRHCSGRAHCLPFGGGVCSPLHVLGLEVT